MKARLCLGVYAANAYCFENLGLSVYCMEELSYCLKEHAFLLGPEIMSDDLLHFIGSDCQVTELAKELYPMVHQKGSLSIFVSTILDYVGFYEEKDIKQVEDTVRLGSGLTDYEKKKRQTDSLVERKKYYAAIESYQQLIGQMEEEGKADAQIGSFIADLYYNLGVVYANLLLYKQAGASFRESYNWKKDTDTLQGYFFARRMELSDSEYVALIAKHPECYEVSLQVEQKMKELAGQWEESPESMGLENMRRWRTTGDSHKYYEECDQIVHIIQEDYRSCI